MEPTTTDTKPQPQNIEAEASLLGAILIDGDALVKIADAVRSTDFFDARHRRIYEAVLNLYEQRVSIDVLTLADRLKNTGELELIGGAGYLTELTNFVPTAAHVEQYADIVAQKSLRRRLIQASQEIVGLGFDESKVLQELIEDAERSLFEVSQQHVKQSVVSLETILAESFERLDELHKDKGKLRGVPTGYRDLDSVLAGLQRSDLFVIAARPSMGKTAFVLNLAHNVAISSQQPVLMFSLEMSKEQLVDRMLARESGVDAWALRTGNLTDADFEKIGQAMGTLSEAPIYIDDTPGITVSDVRTKARREAHQHQLGLVIIDYLQLMSGGGRYGNESNRVQEISEISRGLKGIARELNVPLIALSQLSRSVESRPDKIPQLADLRESGCLTGDTRVYLPESGCYKPIRELVQEPDVSICSLISDTEKLVTMPVSRAFSTGIKPIYCLITKTGRTIRATGNHKFLTIDGWKRLDEISANECLAVPRLLPSSGVPTIAMSRAELALLGCLVGDGCTLPRHAIQYTTNDLDLAEYVANLGIEVFGRALIPKIKKERTWYQVYIASSTHRTHNVSNPVTSWLRSLEVIGLRSHEKHVPSTVFSQSPERIAIFLQNLWATDGCIHISGQSGSYPVVYYVSSSEQLARDVQSLLLRFNINARLKRVAQHDKGRDQYHVVVSGQGDLLRFIEQIGAVGKRKRFQLAQILHSITGKVANTNRDVIPRAAWRKFAVPAMQAAHITTRQMQTGLNTAYCGTSIYKSNLSRDRTALLAKVVQSTELTSLATSHIYWDQVTLITPDGEEEVFDLTVPETHNFIANDIVVHNSIEQDADIVAFLYREDYYNPETDRKNVLEVQIKKHRNGPTKNIELYFDREKQRISSLDTKHSSPFET